MKKRSTEILQKLLRNPNEEFSLQKLTSEYHISEKTLRNDIQEIEEFTIESGFKQILSFDSQKLSLNGGHDIRRLMDSIYTMNLYQYKMSPEERKIYIVIVLLYHEGYYSMQQLADELFVTRNTIINDCRLTDNYLKSHEIQFVAKSKLGVRIFAEEEKIQGVLVDMFLNLIDSIKSESTFFVRYIIKKAGFIYSLKEIILHMNEFTKMNQLIFAQDVFFEIAVILFVMINRFRQIRYQKSAKEDSAAMGEFDIIGKMVSHVAAEAGYTAPKGYEVIAIEKQILQRRLHPQIQSIDDFEMYTVISHFLLEVGYNLQFDLQFDNLLIESLLSHVKGMNVWNDMDYEWNLECEDYDNFFKIRQAAENKFQILEKYLCYPLTDRMKDSIVIHICAALLRGRKDNSQISVIVSCPGSMATSKYLEAQIKNYFNFHIAGTMTAKQVEEAQDSISDVDFIISTVPIQKSCLPVIVVNPLITVETINQIQNMVSRQNKNCLSGSITDSRARFPILGRIFSIYESGNKQKIDYLNRELQQILDDSFYLESRLGTNFVLLNMLTWKYIKIAEGRLNWRRAMEIAAEDLIRDGYFDERYVQEAIGNVEEYGNYIIINKGIALAHASKEAGVYEDGIGLLVCREGIVFDEGDTVYLLFFFAQKKETDYLNLFKEIIKLGKKQEYIDKIRGLSDANEIYRTMWEILSENEHAEAALR